MKIHIPDYRRIFSKFPDYGRLPPWSQLPKMGSRERPICAKPEVGPKLPIPNISIWFDKKTDKQFDDEFDKEI